MRNDLGRPVAAFQSVEDDEGLLETLEILADPEFVEAVRRGLDEAARGEIVSDREVWDDLDGATNRIAGLHPIWISHTESAQLSVTAYKSRAYTKILEDVRAARAWLDEIGVHTDGTRLQCIEQTLETFLTDLESLGVDELTSRWDWSVNQDAYYALSDGGAFARIHDQLEALQSNRLPREGLKRSLQGPLVPSVEQPNTTDARNLFTELDLASVFLRAGIDVTGFDDVQFSFDSIPFVVQCKRPFSRGSVAQNVEGAWRQIEARAPRASHNRGIVAIAVDKIMELDRQRPIRVLSTQHIDGYLRELTTGFVKEFRWTWENVVDDRCVGVMLLFRFLCHILPQNQIVAISYETLIPTTRPGTRDEGRIRRLGDTLGRGRPRA